MIPGRYAVMRIAAGFHEWEYAYAVAVSAARETGHRFRVYRADARFGPIWRVAPAVVR